MLARVRDLPTVDRYVLEGEIGRGGFGAVYRARHAVLDRKVALKVLHPQRQGSGSVLQRFLREAKAVAQLGSPHIVQVLDADMTPDGRAFIAMELLEGEDLAARLARTGRLPTHRAVRLGREVLAGLIVAHAHGIVHRDLKPGNVFLARDARGNETAKILDFGISKVRTEDPGEELTRTGTMLGTPHYMAPEQFTASRSVDARADLYSLGTLLYEALSGRFPYDADTLERLIAVKLSEPPAPLAHAAPDVSHAIADVVMRALADDPARRYQSAREMDDALAELESTMSMPGVVLGRTPSVGPSPSASRGIGATTPMAKPGRSRAVTIVLGIALVLLMFGFAMLALTIAGVWFAGRELDAWRQDTAAAPLVEPGPVPVAPPPRAPEAIAPEPIAPVAPASADVVGVRVVATAMGMADPSALSALAERARPALARCRTASPYREELTFVVMTGGALHDGQRAVAMPSATRDCVVDALVGAGPVSPMPGIARFLVTLDAS